MNPQALSNLPAERALIGAVLIDPKALDQLRDLRPEAFFGVAERATWEAIRTLEDAGKRPADPLVVWDQLTRQGDAAKFEGGLVGLTALASEAPIAANAAHYAELVTQRHKARQMLTLCSSTAAAVNAGAEEIDALLASAQGELAAISHSRKRLERAGVRDQFPERLEGRVVSQREGREPEDRGYPTGIKSLDGIYLGAKPGNLTIVSAPTGGFKSSFIRQWAVHHVRRGGAALIVSLEMTEEEVIEAVYAHDARVSSHKLAKGYVDAGEFRNVLKTSDFLRGTKDTPPAELYVDEDSTDVDEIESAIRQWVAQNKGKECLWFVDYIQLVESARWEGRLSEAGVLKRISRRFKITAKNTKTPGVIVAQFNREADKDLEGPQLKHIEGSGAIAKDASAAIFLGVEYGDNDEPTGDASARVIKQRGGKKGKVALKVDAKTYTFLEVPAGARPHFMDGDAP